MRKRKSKTALNVNLPELANEIVPERLEVSAKTKRWRTFAARCVPANWQIPEERQICRNRLIVLVGAVRFELTTTGTP